MMFWNLSNCALAGSSPSLTTPYLSSYRRHDVSVSDRGQGCEEAGRILNFEGGIKGNCRARVLCLRQRFAVQGSSLLNRYKQLRRLSHLWCLLRPFPPIISRHNNGEGGSQ